MKIWTYLTTLLAGIIAGLLIFLKLKEPDQVINDNQQIGKLKQRGDGVQSIDMLKESKVSTRQELRVERKAGRIERRRERQEKRQSKSP